MPKPAMMSKDLLAKKRDEIRQQLMAAVKENDPEKFAESFEQMLEHVAEDVRADYQQLRNETDTTILAQRGVYQLTSEEAEFYQKFGDALNSNDPTQALRELDVVMPKSTKNHVFDDLRTNHPLLSKISFVPTAAITEFIYNTDGNQKAAWGKLTDEVIKELTSGFKKANITLLSLAAFIPISKAMLKLGPEWLDKYIREILYEAIANGAEYGMVAGTGKEEPIGMIRQTGDDVVITGGVYPEKTPVALRDFSPETMGNLVSLLAVGPNGKPRDPGELMLLVNPQDYYQKIMPATTFNTPNGGYIHDVLPIEAAIIRTSALPRNKAVIGIPRKYFMGVGSPEDGTITYDDSYRFLERERVYLIELYANGFPMDNYAFLVLDISELQPAIWKAQLITPPPTSNNADLSALSLGSVTLDPVFNDETNEYTATTTNAQNTIKATPADAAASIAITVTVGENSRSVDNGSSVVWAEGENVVTVVVTAEDGNSSETYTITVTKST